MEKDSQNLAKSSNKLYLISFVLIVAVGAGVYWWQNNIVSSKNSSIRSLNSQANQLTASNGSLKHANTSLKGQVSKLNTQLQNALANEKTPQPTPTPNATPTPAEPTSELIINDIKQTPASTYWSQAPSGTTWDEVDFTIYNNADKTQDYNISMPNQGGINGVTSTGVIVKPQIPMGSEFIGTTLLAGGSGNGFVLFQPSDGIVKLQWTPPGSSSPVYFALP